MHSLFRLSGTRGTDSTAEYFRRARRKLVIVYLCIIGGVIGLFSLLVIHEASDVLSAEALPTDSQIVVTIDEAKKRAALLHPGKPITESEYTLEHGALYYSVEFADGEEISFNLLNGAIDETAQEGWIDTDDFDEVVILIGLGVFICAACGSMYVATTALSPIAENMRSQRRFITGAAHELRNPLSALHARIESAPADEAGGLDAELRSDLLRETKHLISITEALLAIERQHRPMPHLPPIAVSDRVREVLARLAPIASPGAITITQSVEAGARLAVAPEDFDCIVYNLLHNSVKFSKPNGHVTVSFSGMTLTVTDTGVGIPIEAQPFVFERFFKADPARVAALDGSGLGLALVDEIAKRYRAAIQLESVPGEGTRVSITFTH